MPALSRDRIARLGAALVVAVLALGWRMSLEQRLGATQSPSPWHVLDPAGLKHARGVAVTLGLEESGGTAPSSVSYTHLTLPTIYAV